MAAMVDRLYPMPEALIEEWACRIMSRLPEDDEERDDLVYHELEGVREGAINMLKIIPSYNRRGRYCAACVADVLTSVRFHHASGCYTEHTVGSVATGIPKVASGFSQVELMRARMPEYCLEWILVASWFNKAAILLLFKEDGDAVDNILNDYMCVLEDARCIALALVHKPNKMKQVATAVEFETMD